MKIETLVATMDRKDFNFIKNLNLRTDAIIVNQRTSEDYTEIKDNGHLVKVLSTDETGLSKSRNLALKNATADICVIADDDMTYHDDYAQLISQAYIDYPEADIIAFQVKRYGNEKREKQFRVEPQWENYLSSMKISSVEITFKRECIVNNNLYFNENIGAGTDFPNGEESTFLYAALHEGLKILYLPIEIGVVDISESSWHRGYDERHFKAIGARYYNMTNRFYWLLILQFALRKYSEYKNESSILGAIRNMYNGKKDYKKRYEN
ncbi:glycosyltransferase [Aerococcus urinaeequi]|uniref:glycosyltransferase family A protein n=1 Tax=Aerococcus urinaeequi TaxID=51665 RepID=UPI003B4833F7